METTQEETRKYSTESLDCAACVMALGARITGVKRKEKDEKFLTFMFEAEFDMEKIGFELASETLTINAAKLLNANKRMKSIIHSSPR